MASRLCRHAVESRINQFPNAPNVIRDAKLHEGRDAQGFMDATEVEMGAIERGCRFVVLQLLAERIGEASEPTLLHPMGEVLSFNLGHAEMLRAAFCC